MTHATHYLINDKPRCGHRQAHSWTYLPERVTCQTCLKLMKGKMK